MHASRAVWTSESINSAPYTHTRELQKSRPTTAANAGPYRGLEATKARLAIPALDTQRAAISGMGLALRAHMAHTSLLSKLSNRCGRINHTSSARSRSTVDCHQLTHRVSAGATIVTRLPETCPTYHVDCPLAQVDYYTIQRRVIEQIAVREPYMHNTTLSPPQPPTRRGWYRTLDRSIWH